MVESWSTFRSLTKSSLITKNATGFTLTPAPDPPPNGYPLSSVVESFSPNSLPP